MAQMIDIKKVTIGPRNLEAVVEVAPSAPLMTSDDAEGTKLVLDLMPELAEHVCLGDAAPRFGEVAENTELAHLLEHVTVELLARTDAAGDIASGQTTELGERTYQITLACPDDVLVAGALSSAAWILQWAYSGGGDPRPDIDAIVGGLVDLVASLGDEKDEAAEPGSVDDVADPAELRAIEEEPETAPEAEDVAEEQPESEATAEESDVEPADDAPAQSPWPTDVVPRPHLVR